MSLVTGNALLANGAKYVGSIVFRPMQTPLKHSPSIVVTQDIVVVTDADGNYSTTLEPGRYRVTYGASRAFKICVPDDELEYNILSLLGEILPTGCCEGGGGGGGGSGDDELATATTPGDVKTDVTLGDPIVMTQQTVEADFAWRAPANGSYRFKRDGDNIGKHLQLWNPTTGKWHTLMLFGNEGEVQLSIGAGEA